MGVQGQTNNTGSKKEYYVENSHNAISNYDNAPLVICCMQMRNTKFGFTPESSPRGESAEI